MNETVNMSVSSMTRHGDDKIVYILFTDGDKTAEFTLPECKMLGNRGFLEEEINNLKDYLVNEREYIFSIAGKVDPMKAFLGTDEK